jgi:NitT/TauT family transport system substrate-binding protein
MFKRGFFKSAILAVLILAPSSACAPRETPAKELTPLSIQLLWTHQAQFAGFYAAEQNGYFSDVGLDVTFLLGGPDVARWASVLDGSAQFGIAGADELLLARSEGKSVRAIATIYRSSPVVFISLADSGITRPEDFAGKKIRSPANTAPSLHAMSARVGITPDRYTEVILPSDLVLFATGEVPIWGVYITGFVVTAQQAGYKLNIIYPDDYGVHFYADTVFTTDDMIASNPDLVRRFLQATLKGWTFAVENPDEVPGMVQKYQLDADTAIENARMLASLPLINTGEDHIGWMKAEMWAGIEQTLREQGVLASPLDVTQVYTMQFLNEIYQ